MLKAARYVMVAVMAGMSLIVSVKGVDYFSTFEVISATGEVVSLESWRGYYVLIQLWRPGESPQGDVEWAYERLHRRHYPLARGIKFVRCAVTKDFKQWQRQLAYLGRSYVIDVADTLGMASPLVRQFHISEFPAYVVYNQVGEVIYYGTSLRRAVGVLRRASERGRR